MRTPAEVDGAARMSKTERLAAGDGSGRGSKRGGRPVKVPNAAAWSTLEAIKRKAAKRSAKCQQREGGRVHADALVLLRSEKKESSQAAAQRDQAERADYLVQLAQDLADSQLSRWQR